MNHKKANTINPVTRKLNAFMNGMENNDMRDVVNNLQAIIEFKEEELRIYRGIYEKTIHATSEQTGPLYLTKRAAPQEGFLEVLLRFAPLIGVSSS